MRAIRAGDVLTRTNTSCGVAASGATLPCENKASTRTAGEFWQVLNAGARRPCVKVRRAAAPTHR